MASDQQIAANRENAKLGGVKTDEGKAVVRFNARKHGILAQLISDYEENVYQHFLDQVFAEYDPKTWQEEMLVERIAICYLQLYRAGKAEKEFMCSCLDPVRTTSLLDHFKLGEEKGYRALMKPEGMLTLGNVYLRYVTGIENRMYKATHELERLQDMKRNKEASVVADL